MSKEDGRLAQVMGLVILFVSQVFLNSPIGVGDMKGCWPEFTETGEPWVMC